MQSRRLFISICAGGLIILGLLLFQASRNGTSSVLLPSDLVKIERDQGRIRLAGRVQPESIEYQVEPTFLLKFSISDPQGGGDYVAVVYEKIKPDMFSGGRDVILDGEWRGGVFWAHTLMTQCPSKYEAPDPGKKYTDTATVTPDAATAIK